MPKFNPLAQQLVAILQFHSNEKEQDKLHKWLDQYGQSLNEADSYDLYLRLSHSIVRRFAEQYLNERQQAAIEAYEVWFAHPSAHTKYELTKRKKRLLSTYAQLGNGGISQALFSLLQVPYARRSNWASPAELIVQATTWDEESRRMVEEAFPVSAGALEESTQQSLDNYYERAAYIASPVRLDLLRFCLQEYQRIVTTPTTH